MKIYNLKIRHLWFQDSDDLLERFEGGDSVDDFKDTLFFLDRFEDGVSVDDSIDTSFMFALDASLLRREFCVSSCYK